MSKSQADKTRERAEAALMRNQRQLEESRIAQTNAKQRNNELRGEWKKQYDDIINAAANGLSEVKFSTVIIYPGQLLSAGFEILEIKNETTSRMNFEVQNEFKLALDSSTERANRQEIINIANNFYNATKSTLGRDFYAFQRFSEEFPNNLDWMLRSNIGIYDFLTADYFGREFHKIYNGPFRVHLEKLKKAYDGYKNKIQNGTLKKQNFTPKSKSVKKSIIQYILSTRSHWPTVSQDSYFDESDNDSVIKSPDAFSERETASVNEGDEELFPHQPQDELVVRWTDDATCYEHLSKPLMSPEGLNWLGSKHRRQLIKSVIDTLNRDADQGKFPSELELSRLTDIWFVRDHQGIMRPSCLPDDLVYLLKNQGYRVTSSGRSKSARTLTVK